MIGLRYRRTGIDLVIRQTVAHVAACFSVCPRGRQGTYKWTENSVGWF